MKIKVNLPNQVLFSAALPSLAYLLIATIFISGLVSTARQTQIFKLHAAYMKATSDSARELQRERGKTGLYLFGNLSEVDLKTKRSQSDKELNNLKGLVALPSLPDDIRTTYNSALNKLEVIRASVDSKTAAPAEITAGYTGIIEKLLKDEIQAAKVIDLHGLEGFMYGIGIVENAREIAGRLSAFGINIISKDKAIDRPTMLKLSEYITSIGPILHQEGIQISEGARSKINDISLTPQWITLINMSDVILQKADQGKYGLDQKIWWDNATKVTDNIGEIIDGELKELSTIADSYANAATQELWTHLILAVVIISLCIFVQRWISVSGVAPLVAVVEKLGVVSAGTKKSSVKLTASAERLSGSAAEQSAAIHETDASLSEISSMVAQTTTHTVEADELVSAATSRAESGRDTMEKMVSSMQALEEANILLKEITGIISEISHKTDVINDIAFKTQLLSFNASIEAERAGQHGRGFAVVANEVSNLAITSAKAAGEVDAMLKDGGARIAHIVTTTGERVADGKRVSGEANATFAALAGEMTKIADYVGRIRSAAREQEAGIRQISVAMSMVNTSTSEIQGMATESVDLARSLTQSSSFLERLQGAVHLVVRGADKIKKKKPKSRVYQLIHDGDSKIESELILNAIPDSSPSENQTNLNISISEPTTGSSKTSPVGGDVLDAVVNKFNQQTGADTGTPVDMSMDNKVA